MCTGQKSMKVVYGVVVVVCVIRHFAGAEKTISELRQKVEVLDSALQQISKQLNASENSKKASETKAKQYEERVHEMEASMVSSKVMWMAAEWSLDAAAAAADYDHDDDHGDDDDVW